VVAGVISIEIQQTERKTEKRTKILIENERLKRPKIICSPSYADFRSRANAAIWLDLDHMTKGEHIQEI
jgi:hypothetical protein